MRNKIALGALLGSLALVALPGEALAHAGHAGDHGLLFGALQPLLSVDHFLSALLVVAVGGVVVAALGVARARVRRRAERKGVA